MAPDGVGRVYGPAPSQVVSDHPQGMRVERRRRREEQKGREEGRKEEDRVTLSSRAEEAAPEEVPEKREGSHPPGCPLPHHPSIDIKV